MKRIFGYIFLLFVFVALTSQLAESKVYAQDAAERLWGLDRYGTAVEISKSGWGVSENAVLATGENFPDALCAAPLARLLDAPILLTGETSLDKKVTDEITRLGVKKIYIIGGQGVISPSVEKILKDKSIECIRISGADRYGTSLAVANYMREKFSISHEIAVTTGENYPDALSIASIAAQKGMPILLSPKSSLSEEVKSYITKNSVSKAYIVGGTGVISDNIEKQLPDPKRLGGDSRYQTNVAVINYFFNEFNFDKTYITTGNEFPDAISGSALAAKYSSPVILNDKLPEQSTQDFVSANRLSIKQMIILGGEGVVAYSSVEPLLPKIVSINDVNAYVNQGSVFILPIKLSAAMDNNTTRDVPVLWDLGNPDTNNGVAQIFTGSIKGYDTKVKLTLVIKHDIMGTKAMITPEQMVKFLLSKSPSPSINCTPLELAKMFIEEGEIEGVRGDIAFCQSIHETGWFKYGGQVLPEQNNFAGIGATNGSTVGKGAWFATPREGVRAQIQHLKAYASVQALKQECIDPRYDILVKNNLLGIAPKWEDISGRWAVPGYDTSTYKSLEEAMQNGGAYGQTIIKLYEDLKNVK